MNDADILPGLIPIFRNVFNDDALEITPETAVEDIAGWDSMAKITLAVEIEHYFSIKFGTSEMKALGRVGDLIALVASHRNLDLIHRAAGKRA